MKPEYGSTILSEVANLFPIAPSTLNWLEIAKFSWQFRAVPVTSFLMMLHI